MPRCAVRRRARLCAAFDVAGNARGRPGCAV